VIEFNTGSQSSKSSKKNKQIFNHQFERNDGHILDTNSYNNDNNSDNIRQKYLFICFVKKNQKKCN